MIIFIVGRMYHGNLMHVRVFDDENLAILFKNDLAETSNEKWDDYIFMYSRLVNSIANPGKDYPINLQEY